MTVMLQPEVLVLSADGAVRAEVEAAVARQPGAHAVYASPDAAGDTPVAHGPRIVVIDDEGRKDAIDLLRRVMARSHDASVVYLAADHSPALEAEVRRAGVTFYTVKSARDGDLTRVIEVMLARSRA
jgi:DNA-binding NarL/FixJ family response regulator